VKNLNAIAGALWLAGALAFNGIPGTGTLRSFFLLLGLVHLVWIIRQRPVRPSWPDCKPELGLLIAVVLWFFAQCFLFASEPNESFKEVISHWGKILIVIFMTVAFVAYSEDPKETRNWLVLGTFLSSFFHVLGTLVFQVWQLATTGKLPIGHSLLGNYGYVSPFTTMSLALLTAEIVARIAFKKAILPLSFPLVWLSFFLTICAEGLLAAKAGYLMSVVQLALACGILNLICKDYNKFIARVVSIVFLASLAIPFLFANRWTNIGANIAVSIKASDDVFGTFISPDLPIPEADPSIFLRYSWAKAGLDAIANRPMGYGYGSIGYGQFIEEKTGFSGAISSHSGWIDFTIDNGVPGFLLLILLTGVLLKRGWMNFVRYGNPANLALVLTILNYMGRCAIDGHLSGSRLTGFALATAALWAASSVSDNEHKSS
jgi:hypothetical protein